MKRTMTNKKLMTVTSFPFNRGGRKVKRDCAEKFLLDFLALVSIFLLTVVWEGGGGGGGGSAHFLDMFAS